MPSERNLTARLEVLSPTIASLCQLAGTPGLSYGVFHHGRIIHTQHFGRRDATSSQAPDDESVYYVASLFKIVTVCAIAKLVTDGALEWDQPIREYLPEFQRRTDEVGLKATIRDLISNRTGIPMESFYWAQEKGEMLLNKSQMVRVVTYIQAVRPFRKSFIYSQWNFILLHILVEKITSKPFSVFVKDAIFDPLGLRKTTFGLPPDKDLVPAHAALNDGSPHKIITTSFPDSSGITAGAGGKSTTRELLQVYIALLAAYNHQCSNNVDVTPGSPFTQLRTIFTPHIKLSKTDITQQGYCLGLYRTVLPGNLSCGSINSPLLREHIPIFGALDNLKEEIFHHSGNTPGYFNAMYLVPRTNSGVAVLTNSTPLMDAADFTAQLLLAAVLDSTPPTPPSNLLELALKAREGQIKWYSQVSGFLEGAKTDTAPSQPFSSYAGTYVNEFGFVLRVTARESELRLCVQDSNTKYVLKPWDEDTFYWEASREKELCERAMWIFPLPQWHLVNFEVEGKGVVALTWQLDELTDPTTFVKATDGERSRL